MLATALEEEARKRRFNSSLEVFGGSGSSGYSSSSPSSPPPPPPAPSPAAIDDFLQGKWPCDMKINPPAAASTPKDLGIYENLDPRLQIRRRATPYPVRPRRLLPELAAIEEEEEKYNSPLIKF